jgi:predicted permease
MRFFISNFKWIMLVSGLLTCTMLQAFISPQASLQSNFGQTMEGELSEIIVRNWGALIGLIGIMLIYGAFTDSVRRFVLVIAGSSKVIFILLVLSSPESYMGFGAGTAVVADSFMVALYITYLLQTGQRKNRQTNEI